jgi:hypothetical protein
MVVTVVMVVMVAAALGRQAIDRADRDAEVPFELS